MDLKFSGMFLTNSKIGLWVKKRLYPSLEDCIKWVKDKLKREGSSYMLTKDDIEEIELAYEFQTSDQFRWINISRNDKK